MHTTKQIAAASLINSARNALAAAGALLNGDADLFMHCAEAARASVEGALWEARHANKNEGPTEVSEGMLDALADAHDAVMEAGFALNADD